MPRAGRNDHDADFALGLKQVIDRTSPDDYTRESSPPLAEEEGRTR